MNAQNTAKTEDSSVPKPSLKDRIKQSPITSKTTKVLAGVGATALVVVAVATAKNKKNIKVQATLPDVDVTTS